MDPCANTPNMIADISDDWFDVTTSCQKGANKMRIEWIQKNKDV
jgi:hypothetical protein